MHSQAQWLNDLRARAVAQWAAVRGEEPSQESKRRGAIVEEVIDLQDRLPEGTPVSTAEISAIEEKLNATDQASCDAFVGMEQERYENKKKARQGKQQQIETPTTTESEEQSAINDFARTLAQRDFAPEDNQQGSERKATAARAEVKLRVKGDSRDPASKEERRKIDRAMRAYRRERTNLQKKHRRTNS